MKKITQDDIENLIDLTSLNSVLCMIEDICYLKAEHLRSNWQSPNQAKDWEYVANSIDTLVANIDF